MIALGPLNMLRTFVAALVLRVTSSGGVSCKPLTCTAGFAVIRFEENASYSVTVDGVPWLTSGDHALRASNGTWYSLSNGGLAMDGCGTTTSTDPLLGPYTLLEMNWYIVDHPAPGGQPLTTRVTCFPTAEMALFEQRFTDGATNITYTGAPNPAFNNFNLSTAPAAHFPSWAADETSPVSRLPLGRVEWAGEHSSASNAGTGWGRGYVGGQLGGPVVLHDANWSRSGGPATKPRAMIFGPMQGFKHDFFSLLSNDTSCAGGGQRWVFGPSDHLPALPKGYNTGMALVAPSGAGTQKANPLPNERGVAAAVYWYGALMRVLANTARFAPEADIGSSVLSYSMADGGMVYGDRYWGQAGAGGTAGAVVGSVRSALTASGTPAASFQLGAWWCNASNWTPAAGPWGPTGYQQGVLAAGVNVTLYSSYFNNQSSDVWFNQFDWVSSPPLNNSVVRAGGRITRISPQDSRAFHDVLMGACIANGCVGFEADFLSFNFLAFNDSLSLPGTFDAYMSGLSDAAAAVGVPVLLSRALPSDVLLSVKLRGVTAMRSSADNDYTTSPPGRWRVGLSNLLYGAMDLRPFFDGTWTHAAYLGADAAMVPFPPTYAQNATELNMAQAVFSTGGVGVGDKAGFTNATLAGYAVAANGVILKPSLPAVPVEAYFWYGNADGTSPLQVTDAELVAAPSFIPTSGSSAADACGECGLGAAVGLERLNAPHVRGGGGPLLVNTFPATTPCPFMSLLAVNVAGFTLFPGDLAPSLNVHGNTSACATSTSVNVTGYVAVPWAAGTVAIASACADGAPAASCVQPFGPDGMAINTGVLSSPRGGVYYPFEIYSLAPTYANGYALLGELGKLTRVSPLRFSAIQYSADGSSSATPWMSVVVRGAPNETVEVTVVAPSPAAAAGVLSSADAASPSSSSAAAAGSVKSPVPGVIVKTRVTFPANGGSALLVCSGAKCTAQPGAPRGDIPSGSPQ